MAQFVQVRIKGAKETFLFLKKLPVKANKEGKKLTKRIARKIWSRAREIVAPFKTGSGDLKRSIQMIPIKGGKGWTVVAGRGLKRPYAFYQEKGFGAHIIVNNRLDPRVQGKWAKFGRKYLVQRWTPYMAPAFNRAVREMDFELNKAANKIVR